MVEEVKLEKEEPRQIRGVIKSPGKEVKKEEPRQIRGVVKSPGKEVKKYTGTSCI